MARPSHNTQTVLREYVDQQLAERAPSDTFERFFEFFAAHLLLRDRGLSDEEIQGGLIGGGGDGGIDAAYIFVDDILVAEDTDLSIAKSNAKVEVEIIQATTERVFSEERLNRLTAVSEALFGLDVCEEDFSDVYGEGVRATFQLFRQSYRALLRKAPTLSIRYHYASFRPPSELSAGINASCARLRTAIAQRFPDAHVEVSLYGAADLWERVIRRPRDVRTLTTERASPGRDGYICLVSLSNIDAFLRDSEGRVSSHIFDENVRDWQGLTPVNQKIALELKEGGDRDFWWLNNGITVICAEYRNDDNLLTITNPQIVNGLQTCKEIAQFFENRSAEERGQDGRSVIVKVIRVRDDETRDKVIRATNSQNSVSVAMLRATDPFQRSVEQFLLGRDLYYERRRNYYANRGRPSSKIVSLTFMAQALLAICHFRPDDARARPSNPLKSDKDYKEIFGEHHPIASYYVAAYICRFVELYLKKEMGLDAKTVNNLRFYVSLSCAWMLAGQTDLTPANVAQIDVADLSDEIISEAYTEVKQVYVRLGGGDDVARGSVFKTRLRRRFDRKLRLG